MSASVQPTDNGEADSFAFGANANAEPPAAEDTTESQQIVEAPAASQSTAETTTNPDPFDPASLRLSGDFAAAAGVKKLLLSVPHRKPDKTSFVRAHSDPAYRLQTYVIEMKEERELYLVAPPLWPDLSAEATFKPKMFVTAINRQGVLFLWEVNLPRSDGRVDEWSRSALEAVDMATKSWVRVVANMSLGAYEVFEATGPLGEPVWPTIPLQELLRLSFRNHYINTLNDPVLRRLRGEV
jgi:hypothetical protein